MRADTSEVAFRLLLALGDLWDGLQRARIDPTARGLHLTSEYLGGYIRISAGPASHSRLIVEWNEATRHLRVLRCEGWPGFEATLSSTVAHVRLEARSRGISDVVDRTLVRACEDCGPVRRTVLQGAVTAAQPVVARRA